MSQVPMEVRMASRMVDLLRALEGIAGERDDDCDPRERAKRALHQFDHGVSWGLISRGATERIKSALLRPIWREMRRLRKP